MSLPEALPVLADSFKLGNAIREIRQNAQEAMAAVFDRAKVVTVVARAKRSAATSQAYAQLEITDSGPGFAEKVRLRLFQPYFTTKSNGTGMGLATAYKVISAHGGMIEAENSLRGGARFVVRLPLIADGEDVFPGASNV